MLSFTEPAVTPAEAGAYADARGWSDWAAASESGKVAALRRGQDYLAGQYNDRWKSDWANSAAPEGVKFAIIEAARRDLAEPGSLLPDWSEGTQLKREKKKVGPLEKELEYAVPTSALSARPVFGIIEGLLAGLLASANGLNVFKITRA